MPARRLLIAVALCSLILGGQPAIMAASTVAADVACFTETNFCVGGRFLDYWHANGGLARNGFPLSEERRELLEDGREYTVQYFERVRLEYHPENAPPYDVLLGQFGRRIFTGQVMSQPPALDERFRPYWEANGGLTQFGYPLAGAFQQELEDGKIYTVQYFERARLELHPENADTPYTILVGQFGRRVQAENALVAEPFRTLFIVRQTIGRPLTAATVVQATYLTFERGALLYQPDTRTIHLFDVASDDTVGGGYAAFPDTWTPDQAVGGGLGPSPDLYEPGHGFGKLWRENPEVRARLGYATAPTETAYTLTLQTFATVPLSRSGVRLFTRPFAGTAYAVNQATYNVILLR